MRDPHVARLIYQIGSEEGTAYRNPPPLSFTNALAKFKTDGTTLTVEPVDHFASEGEARAVIDPYLRSWEIEADLIFDLGTVRFTFERGEIIDRSPPPPGVHILMAEPGRVAITGQPVTLTITRSRYPEPPPLFRTSPEVQAAYQRWRSVRLNQEPLLGMAYWLLTLIEAKAGGRKTAATVFTIDPDVLNNLGNLTANRGDLATARKITPRQQPLAPAEQTWLEAVVKRIIRRLGEHGSGAVLPRLRMSDLPPI